MHLPDRSKFTSEEFLVRIQRVVRRLARERGDVLVYLCNDHLWNSVCTMVMAPTVVLRDQCAAAGMGPSVRVQVLHLFRSDTLSPVSASQDIPTRCVHAMCVYQNAEKSGKTHMDALVV
jgi:hypothetical protein